MRTKTFPSVVRAFCPGYFPHFASGLEPRHIGARPKGTPFGLGYHPKPYTQFSASGQIGPRP